MTEREKPIFVQRAEELAAKGETHVALLNSRIDDDAVSLIRGLVHKGERISLVLTTFGGDPHAAFRIGRALQGNYKRVSILVPSMCKSAGTLLAAAGHEIVMDDAGELGPLDVLLPKPEELGDYASSAVLNEAISALLAASRDAFREQLLDFAGALPTSVSAPIACQLTGTLFGSVFSKLDPHRIGEVTRGHKIGFEYLTRLGRYSRSITDEKARQLVGGYPDHAFVIDRAEAADLFSNVRAPSSEEQALLDALGPLAYDPEGGPKVDRRLILTLADFSTNGPGTLQPTTETANDTEDTIDLADGDADHAADEAGRPKGGVSNQPRGGGNGMAVAQEEGPATDSLSD